MRYLSTRGAASALGFDDVLLTGLARDGGLFLPEAWPSLDLNSLIGLDYPDLAAQEVRRCAAQGANGVASVQLRSLTKRYGTNAVVDDISLTI